MKSLSASVTAVIVSYNTRELLLDCLRSLARAADEVELSVIVVDNGSGDGSVEAVRSRFEWVTIVGNKENRGFAAALNQGIRGAKTDLILSINPDALLTRGLLRSAVEKMKVSPEVGILGFQPTGAWGELQPASFRFPSLPREFWNLLPELKRILVAFRPSQLPHHALSAERGNSGYIPEFREVEAISGAAMLLRKAVWEQLGGFDEGFFLYHEEIDYCTRVRAAGFRAICSDLQVIHFDAQASGYVPSRLAQNPVLSWRVLGMMRLWQKHRSDRVTRWVSLAQGLLALRVVILAVAGALGMRARSYVDKRISDLQELRRHLAAGPESGEIDRNRA